MTPLPRGIYKRGKSYYVRWKQGGTWKHKSAGPNLGAALELQGQVRGSEDSPDAVRLPELVERYLKRLETYGKPRTVVCNRSVTKTLTAFFRSRPIESLSSTTIMPFVTGNVVVRDSVTFVPRSAAMSPPSS